MNSINIEKSYRSSNYDIRTQGSYTPIGEIRTAPGQFVVSIRGVQWKGRTPTKSIGESCITARSISECMDLALQAIRLSNPYTTIGKYPA